MAEQKAKVVKVGRRGPPRPRPTRTPPPIFFCTKKRAFVLMPSLVGWEMWIRVRNISKIS